MADILKIDMQLYLITGNPNNGYIYYYCCDDSIDKLREIVEEDGSEGDRGTWGT